MANPTFNGFSLQDSTFITERIVFKGYADRQVIRANLNRREGIKMLNTEFGEKMVEISGRVVAASASALQTALDSMKSNLSATEGALILEDNRTFTATIDGLEIPDEHYNQSTAAFKASFICTQPFAIGPNLVATTPITSGVFTFSGSIVISGTLFGRPTITVTPGSPVAGQTNIKTMTIAHTPTGQSVTISGFGSGLGLSYANAIAVNYDDFTSMEGASAINNSGGFSRWEPGVNPYTITVSGRWPGGSVTVNHQPRYI